ncbi:MAG: septal ring lytic transglycosylase RlpA family protein, partial [Candidatus Aminicenantales bacterium]
MKKKCLLLVLVSLPLIIYSCQKAEKPKTVPVSGYVEVGEASWYGPGFHGQLTSSREIFNMEDLTAAHPTLPFGTLVQVTNLENSRIVTV